MANNEPTKAEIEAAIEKSRLYLEEKSGPPRDAHPGPTTPTKAEIKAALEKSADYLRSQGHKVIDSDVAPPAAAGPADSAVSMTGTPTAPDSPPVDASRDTSNDSAKMAAKPTNTTADKPKD